jgi:hypothetical protein
MKRNVIIAVIVTAAVAVAVSGPALARSGHGGGAPTTPPKPAIHPNSAVKEAIWPALNSGTIVAGE